MKTTFSFRFSKGETSRETLVVYCPPGTTVADVIRNAATDATVGGFPDEILILAPEFLATNLLNFGPVHPTIKRLSNLHDAVQISVQPFDENGAPLQAQAFAGRSAGKVWPLATLFTMGITQLFHDRGGEIRSSEGFHFLNPSGKHSRNFLRLSNLLVRQPEISFLAAALLPHVPSPRRTVLIDTPSLFSIVGALNQLRLGFGLTYVAVENFGSYGGVLPDIDTPESTTFLVSASTSGSLARKLRGEASAPLYTNDQFVHFLYLANAASEFAVVCDLTKSRNPSGISPEISAYRSSDCKLCESGSFPVRLLGDQFEIGAQSNIAVEIERTVLLARSVGSIARDLVGAKALRVRTDAEATFTFHVDVPALLAASKYTARLEYVRSRAFPAAARAVVHLNDVGSQILAERLTDQNSSTPTLSQGDLENTGLPSGSGAIVVVAGALGSGRAFRAMGLTLRTLAPEAPLIFIAGFSKAPVAVFERMKKTLTYSVGAVPHEVVVVETVALPDRGFKNPWIDELELLQSPEFRAIETPAAAIFEARRDWLSQQTAKADGLFWPAADGSALAFTDGFVFWNEHKYSTTDASQGDLYFAIASLIHTLRTNADDKNLRSTAFRHPVLSGENFARFSDPALQACLLRAADPSELNYLDNPDQSLEMRRLLTRIVAAPTTLRGGPAMEVLIALATGRLKLRAADTKGLVDEALVSQGCTEAMKVLCHHIQPSS